METTSVRVQVALDQAEALLKQSLRCARGSAATTQADRYVRSLAKDMLSRPEDRTRAVRQILALMLDAALRGGRAEDLEAFWLNGLAVTRAWMADLHAGDAAAVADARALLAALHLEEQRAQGEREVTEAALAHEPTCPKRRADFLRAAGAYAIRDARFIAHVRDMEVRTQVAPLSITPLRVGQVRVIRRSTSHPRAS